MSEMIERVAAAIADCIHRGEKWPWRPGASSTPFEAEDVRDMARAAVAAMPDPTDKIDPVLKRISRIVCCPDGCYCETTSPPAEACYATALHYSTAEKILLALREPTNAMAEAAQGYTVSNDLRQAVWAWEAMIDEALK